MFVRCFSGPTSAVFSQRTDLAHLSLSGKMNVGNFVVPRDDYSMSLKSYRAPGAVNSYVALNEALVSHQKMGIVALLLATPLEALEETCEADESIINMNMPLLLLVALIGATVGALVAQQRKGELQRLNVQLRQINAALKRQAKIESYAPTLSYAPMGTKIPENQVIVDLRKQDLMSRLKNNKNLLSRSSEGLFR